MSQRKLANSTTATLQSAPTIFGPRQLDVRWRANRELQIVAGGQMLILTVPQRSALAESARQAGATYNDELPLSLALVLAWMMQHQTLPDSTILQHIGSAARMLPALPPATPIPMAEVRATITAVLQPGNTFHIVPGIWNCARFFIGVGQALWQLSPEQAAWWGSIPMVDTTGDETQSRILCGFLSALGWQAELTKQLPLPVAASATTSEVWIDVVGLRTITTRPDLLLKPSGLGAHGDKPIEGGSDPAHLWLSIEIAESLAATARALLYDLPRPVRYLGRVVDVAVPSHLMPALAAWEITTIRIQIGADHLLVALLDAAGHDLVITPWKATPASANRAPLAVPCAAWSLLHPTLAGLWHDLCSDAITVPPPEPSEAHRMQATAQTKRNQQHSISLPVRKAVQVVWADATDEEALKHSRRGWNGYRRLPNGWMDRAGKADFQRRQEAARDRAAKLHIPSPPPGFTVVVGRTSIADTAEHAPSLVRSQGLFSVLLALEAVPVSE